MLRKEFDFLHSTLQTETKLIDFSHIRPLFLGHNDRVPKHKINTRQNKFNKLLKDKKPQHEVLSVEDLDFAKTKTKDIALFSFHTCNNNVPPSKREFDTQEIYHKTNISSFKDLEKIIL